jgi:hypothetical protein
MMSFKQRKAPSVIPAFLPYSRYFRAAGWRSYGTLLGAPFEYWVKGR